MVNEAAKEHFNMLRELLANVNDSIRIEFIKWYNHEGWGIRLVAQTFRLSSYTKLLSSLSSFAVYPLFILTLMEDLI